MATVDRMRRATRWFAGAGVLALPACAALEPELTVTRPPAGFTTQATPKTRPTTDGPVGPAAGGGEVVPKTTPALPAVPAAAGKGSRYPSTCPPPSP